MLEEQKPYENEEIFDKNGELLLSEFYYQVYEGKHPHASWVSGLVKVFDYSDKSEKYSFEAALDYMDDDQETLFAVMNQVVCEKAPKLEILTIFSNPIKNEDGTNNLLKQVLVIYGFGENNYIVVRAPFYGLSKYAQTTFIDNLANKESEGK